MNDSDPGPVKDEDNEHPVAGAWRPTFRVIVSAFVRGEYQLAGGVDGVQPVSAESAKQISDYIADYGETLVELSDETWDSSVAQWMNGYWDVLVDLWTEGEGRSDLVLGARVYEAGDGYRFEVGMVYVP
jgi:hypothetical protein